MCLETHKIPHGSVDFTLVYVLCFFLFIQSSLCCFFLLGSCCSFLFFFRNVSCFFPRYVRGGEGDATKRRFSLVFCRCSVFPLVFLGFFPPGGVKIPQVLVGNSRSTSEIFTSTCRVPPRIWLILSFGWFLFFSLFFLFLLRLFFRQGGGLRV